MKKQTAVEWLINELSKRPKPIYNTEIDKLFEQAKAMEKEQIEEAWMDGMEGILHKIAAEKYYNETYNNDTP